MATGVELLRERQYKELWRKYCGFIDLSLPQFMSIQRHLLLEQIELLKRCELGMRLMGGAQPRTVAEFREQVPLTTYADYAPYLLERRKDVLPAPPVLWQRTSGNSGEYDFKWAPLSQRMYQEMGPVAFAILILATCSRREDICFGEGEKILYALAPPPYATGCWGRRAVEELPIRFFPPVDTAEDLPFEERLALGLRQALDQGLDLAFALPSVLTALGEQISQRSRGQSLRPLLRRPRALLRVVKAVAKSKLARRSLLPKDLWPLRGIATVGSDATIYRERIRELWGRYPLDVYGCTEGLILAMQAWDRQGMTFLPHLNFLEFIPLGETAKLSAGYTPRTVLLDEVVAGESYEVVITNFLGGAFLRYRLGDMVTIVAQRNEALDIDLPQMAFYSRCDGLVDLAGFTRLTERTIWQAIERAGVCCEEWTARKEARETPVLHLYLELKEDGIRSPVQVAAVIHEQLKRLDTPYAELEGFLGLKPLEVTLLPSGAFRNYMSRQRAAGADLAHLKPPHVNPPETALRALLQAAPPTREPATLAS